SYLFLSGTLIALVAFVLPKLPREVIGTPDSDIILFSMDTSGNTVVKQIESQADEVERRLLSEFGDKIDYTFTQIRVNPASILAKLKDRKQMAEVWTALEKSFTDTPLLRFHVEPWNPSELPIPDPADLRVAVRGGDLSQRRDATLEISDLLEANHIFDHVNT